MSQKRFFLDQDGDCHWFVVPVERAEDWKAWKALDQDTPAAWHRPDYAEPVSGNPSSVTFSEPQI